MANKGGKTSKYYGVSYCQAITARNTADRQFRENHRWLASIVNDKIKLRKHYATEREAAIAVDKALILNGEQPRNILKPTNKAKKK